MGFTKKEFKEKFKSVLNQWDDKSKEEYFKYHIFADQINSNNIASFIWNTRKFNSIVKPLTIDKLNEISASTNIEPYFNYEDESTKPLS